MLVDDHEVVRLGLKALIERQPSMEVVAEASSAPEARSHSRTVWSWLPETTLPSARHARDETICLCPVR